MQYIGTCGKYSNLKYKLVFLLYITYKNKGINTTIKDELAICTEKSKLLRVEI